MANSNDFLKKLKSINPFIDTLEDSNFGKIEDYISTGSYVLNSIISGDIYKGIPAGRVIVLSGQSGTGKSFVAASIAREAIKKDYTILWVDTENATDVEFAERLGMDPSKVIYIPSVAVTTLEDFRNVAFKMLKVIEEDKDKTKKYVMILDSLGNLSASKELKDAEASKSAADMGQRSKVIRGIFRVLTPLLVAKKITFIAVNHTYTNTASLYGGQIESGGEGAVYNPTVSIRFSKSKVKDKKDDKKIVGVQLRAVTTKNRISPPWKEGRVLLDFATGVNKYFGLLDAATGAGIINKEKTRYAVKGKEKLYWEKDLYRDDVMGEFLSEINEWLHSNSTYSTIMDDTEKKMELLNG